MRLKILFFFFFLGSLVTQGQITGAYQPAYDFKQIDSIAKVGQSNTNGMLIDPSLIRDRLTKLENEIPLNYNFVTHQFVEIFAFRKASFTKKMLERKDVYFPLYEKYLKKYGLPDELKYLSLIESGLENKAKSNKGAGGLWQFMPYTARDGFGLRVDQYIDERYDAELATDAACRYLKQLYTTFGDWHLALAAYNTGPGNLKRAIRKCGASDFWGIYACLPKETRAYVPQFIAMTYMMNYHWDHSIQPENWVIDIPKDSIMVSGYLNLSILTKLTGFSLDTLKKLNPHILSHFLPKNTQNIKLHIPKSKFDYFSQNRVKILDSARYDAKGKVQELEDDSDSTEVDEEEEFDASPSYTSKRFSYKVRSGENLTRVAKKLGLTVSALKKTNRIKGSKLRKGQILYYYKSVSTKSSYRKSSSKRSKQSSRRKHSKKKKSSKKKSKSKKRRKRR
ncbi:transglycosylase SLT domain-containing protein [Aquirufa sp. HETE-83D]|uniref:Transglycosylase SLT domain-containing protein n=1 Tax=Aquirufa esocilacus TaxID=3096513 RepID=A0ABW6DK34_9BACT